MDITIRHEEVKDYYDVEEMTREAFWNLYRPGCDEHYTTHIIRSHPDYIRELDYIAEINKQIVGSIIYTKSKVYDESNNQLDTLTFGPLCVHPKYQRIGIGTKLIEYTKEIAIEKGYSAIIILGDPHNYCKHGFKNGRDYNISTLDGRFPLGLLVLELENGVFMDKKWKFKESDVYQIDQDKVEEYDKKFKIKEKKYQYSQDLFSMLIRSYLE